MQNIIVFIEPPKKANDISIKAGNLYLNRLCIDEDAAFELSGVHYLEKLNIVHDSDTLENNLHELYSNDDQIDDFLKRQKSMIDSALQKAVGNNSNGLDFHVINVGHRFNYFVENSLREGIQKYELDSILVTTLYMFKDLLISKEKMDHICTGKAYRQIQDRYEDEEHLGDTNRCEESVNDDLESFFENLRIGLQPNFFRFNYWNWTHFLPKLTQDELKLVEEKNKDYFQTFLWSTNPDVDEDEMKSSSSSSKFVSGYCRRKTFRIKNPTFQSEKDDSDMDGRNNCCACQ